MLRTETQAARLLRTVGMSPKYKGYTYALFMLARAIEEPMRTHNVSALLYVPAGESFHVTPRIIERNLRFAIARTWDGEAGEAMRRLFQSYGIRYTPTNREFLCVLADCARRKNLPQPRQIRMW